MDPKQISWEAIPWIPYQFRIFSVPLLLRGLPCLFRNTANHTFRVLPEWEGKYRWLKYYRKQSSVQSYLAVVQFTTTEVIFHTLVPLPCGEEMTTCEGGL